MCVEDQKQTSDALELEFRKVVSTTWVLEQNPSPLQEGQVLLNTDSLLQPTSIN